MYKKRRRSRQHTDGWCPQICCKHHMLIARLLCTDIVQFRCSCLRTEIFLRELTLSSTLNQNPKSCRSVDPTFSYKLQFYVQLIKYSFVPQHQHGRRANQELHKITV